MNTQWARRLRVADIASAEGMPRENVRKTK
jgi:hypothetical protein